MVWAGPKWPYLFVCLSVTYHNRPNCVSLSSALGAMATPTSSDDNEPPPATWPWLQAGKRAESVQGAQLWGEKTRKRVCISCQAETVQQAKDRQRAQIHRLDETVEQEQLWRAKAREWVRISCQAETVQQAQVRLAKDRQCYISPLHHGCKSLMQYYPCNSHCNASSYNVLIDWYIA